MIAVIRIGRLIKSFFFPVKCPYCERPIDYREAACEECLHKNFKNIFEREINVYDRTIVSNVAPASYEGKVREAICKYKFCGKKDYACQFAAIMAKTFNERYSPDEYDFITSVPLSESRLKERGYNQAELLARELSRAIKIPYENVLKKVKDNKTQHDLNLEERIENVKGVYAVLDSNLVRGKRVLICDDIITTGSTLSECINELLKSGAKKVSSITFADTSFK